MNGSPVVLVNRTARILGFVADGQHFELTPGDNYGLNSAQAEFAKRQNPQMGTEDYMTLDYMSLVGVKGQDPCDAVVETDAIERFDRTLMPGAQHVVLVPVRGRPRGRIVGVAGAESMAAGG